MVNLFTNFFRSMEINRTANALYRLSDEQLKDIGLRRDQIGAHVSSLFGDR